MKLNLLVLQFSHLDTWLRLFLQNPPENVKQGVTPLKLSEKYPSGQKHLITFWWLLSLLQVALSSESAKNSLTICKVHRGCRH